MSILKSVNVKEKKEIDFLLKGQGVFVFSKDDSKEEGKECKECSFTIMSSISQNFLRVTFTNDNVNVSKHVSLTVTKLVDPNNNKGLVDSKEAYYWFSIDYQNHQLLAGIGEARTETVIYRYKLPKEDKRWIESMYSITEMSQEVVPFSFIRDPITLPVPMIVKNIDELTMEMIASSSYMPSSYLSTVSKKMYECISGKKFVLNTEDFPDFSTAIQYSIITPGLWCYETLKKKSTEFNPDKPNEAETYLRITLGQNNGESPGVPYVMEIWPSGHFSPVHLHAGAEAIIRVLHGEITVNLYPYMEKNVVPFVTKIFNKDEITWIEPNLNQIHKLENKSDDVCITIQCYMYDSDNMIHRDYFDYLDDDGKTQQFDPDSDMDFLEFKELIREEWNRSNKKFWCW